MKREEVENWATPSIWENELRTEIVTNGRRKVRSYDLDGKLLWELTGMTGNVVPTPFSKHGLLYLSSGYPGAAGPPGVRRPSGSQRATSRCKPGETSNQYVAWFQPLLGTYQTSALVYGDYYYTLLDRGLLLCHDAKTGKQMYGRQRIAPEAGGLHRLAVGVQRQGVRPERGRRYLRRSRPGPSSSCSARTRSTRWRWRRRPWRAAACSSARSRRSTGSAEGRGMTTTERLRVGVLALLVLDALLLDGAGARRRSDAHPHAGGHDSRARRSHQGPGSVRLRRRGQDARDLRRVEPCGSASAWAHTRSLNRSGASAWPATGPTSPTATRASASSTSRTRRRRRFFR